MWDFRLGQAFGLMLRTLPFILLRCAVYFGVALAFVLVTGIGAGIGWGIGALGTDEFQASAAAWGGLLGFAITGIVARMLRRYILYMVKAAHIAVLVEMLDGKPLPNGRGQLAHGAAVVKERFGQATVLFGLDLLIKGVIRAITRIVRGLLSIIPGSKNMMGVVNAFLQVSVGLVDEVILAHAIRTRSTNPWASAQTALVLYGQNARPMLKNAAWLTAFGYGFSLLVFILALAPAAAMSWWLPGTMSAMAVLFALVFAWAIKAALVEPLTLTCLLQVYFKVTEGQVPNPEWEQRLEGASDKFRQIKDKALAHAAPANAGAVHRPEAVSVPDATSQ